MEKSAVQEEEQAVPSQGEVSWSSIFMGAMFMAECSEATELGDVMGNALSACRAWLASAMGRGCDMVYIYSPRLLSNRHNR